jgi:exopolysaccharide biosynthesis polyprenyl glycosylphosphotransferase
MNNKFRENLFISLYLILDILLIYLSFTLAYWARFYLPIIPVTKGIPDFIKYQRVIPIIMLIWILVFRQYGLYNLKDSVPSFDEFFRVMKVVTISTIFTMAATFLYREFSYSRVVLAYAWLLNVAFLFVARRFIGLLKPPFLKTRPPRILIMGEGELPKKIRKIIEKKDGSLLTHTSPILNERSIRELIEREKIDEVVITEPVDHKALWRIVKGCEEMGKNLRLVPDILDLRLGELVLDPSIGLPVFRLKPTPLKGLNLFIKRTIDISLSFTVLSLLSPLLLLIGILIKTDSSGPILYKQKRLGHKGKAFTFLKFRTMIKDADKMIEEIKHLSDRKGPAFKMREDPRITKVGRWLRRFSLDELPQLVNVLRGDMSLVGPRPQVLWEAEHYDDLATRRLNIPPGITGLWQVEGRSDLSYEEMIKLDLYYLENWSLELDLRILLRTIPAILKGRGAY